MFGILLTSFGFTIDYIFPYSLLTEKYSLLSAVMFLLLISMLLSLVLLCLNFVHLLERAFSYLFLWWEKESIKRIMIKNLVAHKKRNQFTSSMYGLSIGKSLHISIFKKLKELFFYYFYLYSIFF